MMIVRSLGIASLVALMSAHRAAVKRSEATHTSFRQASVDAIEAYLRGLGECQDAARDEATEQPPSCS